MYWLFRVYNSIFIDILSLNLGFIIGDTLPLPGAKHSRSRSDIVGNLAQRMINESAGIIKLYSIDIKI